MLKNIKNIVGDLYRLDFADGKSYIGACVAQKAEERYKGHRRSALTGSMYPVHIAWRKQGEPKLVILKRGVNSKILWKLENKAIQDYGTKIPYGYNGMAGRDVPPPRLGKKAADEIRKRNSQATTKYFQNPEARIRASRAALKRWRKNPMSDETKERLRQSHLGQKPTEEQNEKNRQSQFKRWGNPENLKKQSLAMKKSWKRRHPK